MTILTIILAALLVVSLGYIAHLLGVRRGRRFQSWDNSQAWNAGFAEAQRFHESPELVACLKDANELCRSAKSIADRNGRLTNWTAFQKRLQKSLDQQHAFLFEHPLEKEPGYLVHPDHR